MKSSKIIIISSEIKEKIDREDPISVVQADLMELEQNMIELNQIYQETRGYKKIQKGCQITCEELDETIQKKLTLLNILMDDKNNLKGIDTSPNRIRCTCFVDDGTCKMVNCPFKETCRHDYKNASSFASR